MVMYFIIIGVALIIMYLINTAAGVFYAASPSIYGDVNGQDEFYRKTVDNASGLVYDFLGLIGLVIGYYIIEPIKWILIIYFGLMLILGVVPFVVAFVLQIYTDISSRQIEHSMWLILLSNFISVCGDLIIVLAIIDIFFYSLF